MVCFIDDSGTKYKGQVRLRGGQYSSSGRVEVFLENQWGTVCTYVMINLKRQLGRDSFALTPAHSVCRQLGYTRAVAYYQGLVYVRIHAHCKAAYTCNLIFILSEGTSHVLPYNWLFFEQILFWFIDCWSKIKSMNLFPYPNF